MPKLQTCDCCHTENRTTGTVFVAGEKVKLCAYCLSVRLQSAIDMLKPAAALAWLTRL
jgi:hypothetical protein